MRLWHFITHIFTICRCCDFYLFNILLCNTVNELCDCYLVQSVNDYFVYVVVNRQSSLQ